MNSNRNIYHSEDITDIQIAVTTHTLNYASFVIDLHHRMDDK